MHYALLDLRAPLAPAQASDLVDAWLAQPRAVAVAPGPGHVRRPRTYLGEAGAAGNLVNDAHLAALASELGAAIVSFDSGFERFEEVRVERPS